jgi:predicted GNAT family acetyltransferase
VPEITLAIADLRPSWASDTTTSRPSSRAYGDDPPYLGHVEDNGRVVMAFVRTPPFGPVLSVVDNPDALDLIAEDLKVVYDHLPGVLGPTEAAQSFVALWESKVCQTPRLVRQERIYRCAEPIAAPEVPGRMQTADEGDKELLLQWINAFNTEALPEEAAELKIDQEPVIQGRFSDPDADLYLWIDNEPVSLAGYGGSTPNGTRVAPVYTPPRFRRRGYATALVGQLTKQLLEEGRRYCFLFTDLSNPTSNSIYQKVGYRPVMDVDQYTFE